MTLRYHAREILAIPEQEIWTKHDEDVEVIFDNEEIRVMSWRAVIASSLLWDFHRDFPEIRLLPEHAIMDGQWRHGYMNKILDAILRTIMEEETLIDKGYVQEKIMEIVNHFYNVMVVNTQEYIVSTNMLDVTEIVESPEMVEILDNLQPTHRSINKAYEKAKALLKDETWLQFNPSKRDIRHGVVVEQQYLQVTVARGFGTDIEGSQFATPNLSGYARGVHSLYGFSIETRSAAKATYAQIIPITSTEYFNRRTQITTEIIFKIFPGDCGSERYVKFPVTEKTYQSVEEMYFYDPEEKRVRVINSKTKQRVLNLNIVRLRTPIDCKHLSENGVCETCLGLHHRAISRGVSVGHIAAISVGERATQKTLGVKHLDKSIEVKHIQLETEDRTYLEVVGAAGNLLRFNPQFKQYKHLAIVVDNDSLNMVADVSHVENRDNIRYNQLSEVPRVGIYVTEADDSEYIHQIDVTDGSRVGYFTPDFLEFLSKHQGIDRTNKRKVVIPLEGWDFEIPFLELPLKLESMAEYLNHFAQYVETETSKLRIDVNSEEGMSEVVAQAYKVLDDFVDVVMPYLTMMLAATLVRSKRHYDYRLPLYGGNREFASRSKLYDFRSLAPAMSYQEQSNMIITPFSITKRLRPNHPFDSMIMGSEFDCMKHYRPRRRRTM